MAYAQTEALVGTQPIAVTNTVQLHKLGTIVKGEDPLYGGGEFIYLKGVANTVAGDVVEYDQYTGATTRWAGTAGSGKPLAIAMSANVANQWGWYQIAGAAVLNTNGTVNIGDRAFWQAAGFVSSTLVAGKQVNGMAALTANGTPSTNKAVYETQRPVAQGNIT